ncbi:hypothetical protein [Nostoc sp.]|uniref:hypothetical protein n=1 Tax=Nostoc sp. TaxID=1180 RepID=UPI002FFD4376
MPSQQIVYNLLKENVMVAQANSQAAKILEVADDPRLSKGTKEFLKVLNSGGVALEKLTPVEARQILVDAQASVSIDLSGIEESEKTITAEGYSITLNIVRPEGVKGTLPVFIFIHGGGWVLPDFSQNLKKREQKLRKCIYSKHFSSCRA